MIINEQSHPALKSFISFLLTGNEIGRSSPTVSIMIFIHLMVHWIGINHVANEIGFELGILYMLRFQKSRNAPLELLPVNASIVAWNYGYV